MKRRIALILAALLLFSTGCSQEPADNSTEETTALATEATDVPTQPTESEPQATTAPTTPTEPSQMHTSQPTQPSTQAPTQPETVATQAPTEPTQTEDTAPPTQPLQTEATQPATEDSGCQHDYQQTFTKAATCTAAGSKKFTCKKCGAVTREEIPIKEHSYKAATCITPKTCTGCSRTDGAALGHSYGENHLCIRCGVKNPDVSPEAMAVDFVATIRSDEGVAIPNITVTVQTAAESVSGVTDRSGKVTLALRAGSSQYTVILSNVPEEYQVQSSYSFSSAQVTVNLKTLPVRTDPNDHSKARYEEGDEMMEFTITDVDGNTYTLSQLLQANKLVIIDFWYVSCNPCKNEFPYFEAALEAYGDDVVLLAIDPFYSAQDIRALRDELGLSFPLCQDSLGLAEGFQVESYPTTVFIDSTGTIRKIHRKAFDSEAAFLRAVAAYL